MKPAFLKETREAIKAMHPNEADTYCGVVVRRVNMPRPGHYYTLNGENSVYELSSVYDALELYEDESE